MVLENTSIFDTYINNLFKESNKKIKNYTFSNHHKQEPSLNSFEEDILKGSIQMSRYKTIENLLCKYICKYDLNQNKILCDEKVYNGKELIGCKDRNLEEAFNATLYAKTLLRNDISLPQNNGEITIKDKLDSFLSLACSILNIEDGGAFIVARYKDLYKLEKDISSEDLYTITNVAISEHNELNVPLSTQDSLVCKMFKGIKQKDSKNPMSIFELLYNSDALLEPFESTNVESYSDTKGKIKINDSNETRGNNIYHNLLFFKIAEIEEDNTHINIIKQLLSCLETESCNNIPKEQQNKRLEKSKTKLDKIKDQINNIRNEDLKKQLLALINELNHYGLKVHRFENRLKV